MAKKLGLSRPSAIGNWKRRGVPFEHCTPIEDATAGKVTRADLRPHDYIKHWPDLRRSQCEAR